MAEVPITREIRSAPAPSYPLLPPPHPPSPRAPPLRLGGPIQFASNALSVIKAIDSDLFTQIMAKFTFTGTRACGIKDGLRGERERARVCVEGGVQTSVRAERVSSKTLR